MIVVVSGVCVWDGWIDELALERGQGSMVDGWKCFDYGVGLGWFTGVIGGEG